MANSARAQFSDCTPAQNGWSECIIDGSENIDSCGGDSGADGVNLADIDGDGDLDAMTGWEESNNAFIYFNPTIDPVGATAAQTCPGQWPLVDATGGFATKDVEDVIFADLDRDGAVESMVSSNEGDRREVGLHFLRRPLASFDPHLASSWTGAELPGEGNYYMQGAYGRIRAFYGDDTPKVCNDIVVGAKGSEKEIEKSVEAGGLKVGFDASTCEIDLVTELPKVPDECFHGGIWWWECPKVSEGGPFRTKTSFPFQPDTSKWEKRKIHDAFWVMSLELVDMDGDGDLDVLFDDRRKVGWFENRTSKAQGENLSGWGDPIAIEHINDLEVVSKDIFGDVQPWPSGGPYRFLTRADLNGDGLEDVITTVNFDPKVVGIGRFAVGRWYERLDATGESWARHWIIPTDPAFVNANNPFGMGKPYHGDHDGKTVSKAVAVADIDEDGSLDLVFAVRGTGSGLYLLTQQENSLTTGLWNTRKIASERENYKFDNLQVTDLDGDGDLDIVSTDENAGEGSKGLGTLYYANPIFQANRPPEARCRSLLVEANATCTPQHASVNFQSSDPDGDPLTFVQSPAGPYELGNTPVTLTASDPNEFFDSCTATIVHVDRSAPDLDCPAGAVSLECAAPTGTPAAYSVSVGDNCDANPTSSCDVAAGTLLPVGSTTSRCTASDDAGNEASCDVELTVVDTRRPAITAPAGVGAECASPDGTAVEIGTATASDICAGTLTPTSNAPAAFPVGKTTVVWTADDGNGNTRTASQTVTIADTTLPDVTCPASRTRECTGNEQRSVSFTATASDTCAGDLTPVCTPGPGAFLLGSTAVSCSASDGFNVGTCGFDVTIEDTLNPTITCPADASIASTAGGCSVDRSFSVTASDQCDPTPSVACVDQNGVAVSPAGHTYPVGTTTVTCTATDSSGLTNDCAFDVTVNDPPVVEVSPTSQTVQYSDLIQPVTITATQCGPQDLTLSTSAIPTGLTLSPASCGAGTAGGRECSWTLSGPMGEPTATYLVDVTASDGLLTSAPASATIEVLAESATVAFVDANEVAVEVASAGGDSGMFSLGVTVREKQPDAATTGAARAGNIALATVTMHLVPVGPGGTVAGTCVTGGVTGTGYDAVLAATCTFSGVPVNTYSVDVQIVGGYYTGGGEDVFVVFDPSLGFTSGGFRFTWPGTDDHTNVGYTMKYNKKATKVQGNFLLIRHLPDDSIYRLKSNAVDGLSLGETSGFGWASFAGKATYLEPGWIDPVGNYELVVYVEDHGTPGKDVDRFWIEVRDRDRMVEDALSFEDPAIANAIVVEGGNIDVPHKGPR